ncbi:MAG: hypothetical protein KDE09_07490 [Anaerolineales bacterium]|nr:hypothetical protein [Anaerolineales bacterium]MCB0011892.1 hypothetical protein [Anaerolineales bacterium]MCB0017617.1 hypothetical protein [Anaerolineales bacterium]MCB0027444.1 hypothetical protein [Anaerolineales bacterium]MCB8959642.1 hypothetical protein [Ardenticatenales bacterium]
MYPDDRVLVVYMPSPADWERLLAEGWYRIPYDHAPKGFQAEYYAFYFGRQFGEEKYGIHYFAPYLGHELAQRLDLLPGEPDHPRATEWYYKIQLDEVRRLPRPITSKRWRRLTFAHTTWDRFVVAREMSDLFADSPQFVSRQETTLRERWRWPVLPEPLPSLREMWQWLRRNN